MKNKQYMQIRFYAIVFLLCTQTIHAKQILEDTANSYAMEIKALFKEQQWQSGKIMLDEALLQYKDNSVLLGLLGQYWYHNKAYDKARFFLSKAIESDRTNNESMLLLANVEEETLNYSSAICCINKLLEVRPYSRTLWLRKINLYWKQGNTEETLRMLHRLGSIFPNDTIVRNKIADIYGEYYSQANRKGNRQVAIAALEELLKWTKTEEYFLNLTSLYLQEGNQDRALEISNAGCAAFPHSMELMKRKVGILTEQARYQEAIIFVKQNIKQNPQFESLYDNLVQEAAALNRTTDTYTLYGMIYEKSGGKNTEALDYLLNTAITHGYNEDALFYLRAAKKHYGNTKALGYKEYLIYQHLGNDEKAFSALQKLYNNYPGDTDIAETMSAACIKKAAQALSRGDYADALTYAIIVTSRKQTDENDETAWGYILNSHIALKHYDDAMIALDTLSVRYPTHPALLDMRALILDKTGRTQEALNLYRDTIASLPKEKSARYVIAYEELSLSYIKTLTEAGAVPTAFRETRNLLQLNPESNLGLHYAVNMALTLGKTDEAQQYIRQGRETYPNEIFFKIKEAGLLDVSQQYRQSHDLLQPDIKVYPGNKELLGAFSGSSALLAKQLSRGRKWNEAIAVLDTALKFDNFNKELKYNKGLVYEKLKQYDSAYYYQKYYEPALPEKSLFLQHLKGLANRTYKNELGFIYMNSSYVDGQSDKTLSVATLEFIRKQVRNTYTMRVNYTGRYGMAGNYASSESDTVSGGGTGLQLQTEWLHVLPHNYSVSISIACANRYFPACSFAGSIGKTFVSDLEANLNIGYKRLSGGGSLWSAGPLLSKTWGDVYSSVRLDVYNLSASFYYNTVIQSRIYLGEDARSNISVMAGIGSAPEMSILDSALPGTFSHTNTMVGLGGQYLVTDRLTAGLMGVWYTYYNQANAAGNVSTSYKNVFNIYLQLYVTL